MTSATFKNLKVTATYQGDKKALWGDNYNNHLVTVTNQVTSKKTSFQFWGSIAQPELRSRYDVLNALYCFLSDSVSGLDDFESFCSEFGYDSDSIQALKTFKACQASAKKALNLLGNSQNIYKLLNELSEIAA